MENMWIAPDHKRVQPWLVPGLALVVGAGIAVTLAVRGHLETGLAAFAVLAGYGLQLAYRRREGGHEPFGGGYRTRTHLKAAAATGDVLIAVIVGTVIVQSLRGAEITSLLWLAGVAGVTYFVSVVIFNHAV